MVVENVISKYKITGKESNCSTCRYILLLNLVFNATKRRRFCSFLVSLSARQPIHPFSPGEIVRSLTLHLYLNSVSSFTLFVVSLMAKDISGECVGGCMSSHFNVTVSRRFRLVCGWWNGVLGSLYVMGHMRFAMMDEIKWKCTFDT